ncbi:hypothetical protein CVT26_002022 [Gymnopilus dilepis]|uniref:Uncharacterized protein n=1 Tax=Gymnopilus dilepis TaxID=231916 RepID=A0A409VBT9_9AGAR|nr:hypothetical protein CVT26_002022 [Gymnopilus dilepis]
MNQQQNDPALPIADRPFWDQDYSEDEGEQIQSVADSFVLLKSLKQSRDRWLFHTFPKFSSRGRGSKAADVPTPAPHTINNRGKCNLEIGPHIFHDTIFYEVQYLAPSVPSSLPAQAPPPSTNPYWQSTVPYGSPYSLNPLPSSSATSSNAPTTLTPNSRSDTVSTPLISSLTEASITPVTPSLIHQVNTAAASNPILANLLQLAAANKASEDQIKTLGLLIQSLANMDASLAASQIPSTSQPSHYSRLPPLPPLKEFDLVIEFSEAINDRWLVPRGPCYIERHPNATGSNGDMDLTICIPDGSRLPTNDPQSAAPSNNVPVTLHLKDAPFTILDTISRWVGGDEKMKSHKKYLDSLVPAPRLYLGLQVSTGPLLTQLQAACSPPYVMRPLRQGPAPVRQKRANPSRRGERSGQNRPGDHAADGPAAKKSRVSQSKSSSATPIQCLSCKQTDVPLIMGGSELFTLILSKRFNQVLGFCRPCAAAGGNSQQAQTIPA